MSKTYTHIQQLLPHVLPSHTNIPWASNTTCIFEANPAYCQPQQRRVEPQLLAAKAICCNTSKQGNWVLTMRLAPCWWNEHHQGVACGETQLRVNTPGEQVALTFASMLCHHITFR
jgi:hypothetical protein